MKKLALTIVTCMMLFVSQYVWANYETFALGGNGYDLVAYQTVNKAVPGSTSFYSFREGITYLFSSQKNKDLFDANPTQYLPAYGGYCAMALVLGKKHPTNPEAFRIVNGKLYLNKKDAQKKWLEDVPGHIEKANAIWEKIKDADPAAL